MKGFCGRSLGVLMFLVAVFVAAVAQGQGVAPATQPADLRGQVRYAEGGAAAEFVLVQLEQFGGGIVEEVRTDRAGRFHFGGLKATRYRVTANAPGYEREEQEVDLETFANDYVQFLLRKVAGASPAGSPGGSSAEIDARVPQEARDEFEKGRKAILEDKDFEVGIAHLEKAVKIYPGYVGANLLLGTACMDNHLLDKAEHALQAVLKVNPKSAPALVSLGEIYRQRGRYEEAEKTLIEGLKLDDKSWQGHLALGRLYWDMKAIEKAGPEVGKTIQLKPDCAEAHLLGGNILLRARQAEAALGMFEDYLKLEPNGTYAAQTRDIVAKIKKALAEKKGGY